MTGYLGSDESAATFAGLSTAAGASFAAFNLLLFDGAELWYASDRAPMASLARGIHVLSNAPFGVDWPKTMSAKSGAVQLLAVDDPLERLFDLLATRSSAESAEERYRSAHFMTGPVYGTRCSSVILIDQQGILTFAERSFDAAGLRTGEVRERFAIEAQPTASTDTAR